MKRHLGALGALTLTLALVGCQQATSSNKTTGASLYPTSTATATTTYWNLSTNTEVTGTDINTTKWDIAVSSATQGIWTNSGDTAAKLGSSGTGGVGGVYYSRETVWNNVVSYNSGNFSADYTTDKTATVSVTGQSGTTTTTPELNVMTKLAYTGAGTTAVPFTIPLNSTYTGLLDTDGDGIPDAYEQDASSIYFYYKSEVGSNNVTDRVYVVRSGDGTKYFKLQITSMSGDSTSRVRTIKCAQLTSGS